MESNPENYTIEIDGKSIENWRLINMDSKILEQEFRGKIPSPEEVRNAIMSVETLVPHKTKGKTSVYKPYKKLWESQGVSWPKPCIKSSKIGNAITCDAFEETHDAVEAALYSPQRKKAAPARDSSYIYQDDYTLALGMQNSYDTLPDSFDLDVFEHTESTSEDLEGNSDEEETQQPQLFDQERTVVRKDTNIEAPASTSVENFSEAFERVWNNMVEGHVEQDATQQAIFDEKNTAMGKNIEASASTSVENISGNISEAEGESERNKSTLNMYALAEAAMEMLENDL